MMWLFLLLNILTTYYGILLMVYYDQLPEKL